MLFYVLVLFLSVIFYHFDIRWQYLPYLLTHFNTDSLARLSKSWSSKPVRDPTPQNHHCFQGLNFLINKLERKPCHVPCWLWLSLQCTGFLQPLIMSLIMQHFILFCRQHLNFIFVKKYVNFTVTVTVN